jgi:hypothetical protein
LTPCLLLLLLLLLFLLLFDLVFLIFEKRLLLCG